VRREAIDWAAAVALNRSTVYLDTETTGLDSTAEIIEISVLDGEGRTLLDTLVSPEHRIPQDAEAVHGISNEMVRGAPSWIEIHGELQAVLAGKLVVVYNADFDYRMVSQMNVRHTIRHKLDIWECAMQRYSAFAGVWHDRYGNYRWHRLDQALYTFGHPPGGHRALADATACKLVVEGMASAG
jgi:DNA polymerase III subunit epsilon